MQKRKFTSSASLMSRDGQSAQAGRFINGQPHDDASVAKSCDQTASSSTDQAILRLARLLGRQLAHEYTRGIAAAGDRPSNGE